MKKINFIQHILPHAVAIVVFLIVTVFFFSPIFFKHQSLSQHDIQQWEGTSKELRDYRTKTGDEGLWAGAIFSGMPAYLINVQWSNEIPSVFKRLLSLGLPHGVNNIFLAFLCYYIMLLAFRVRPYLALTGAIAFGLSSFMIIGLGAGHNSRIGAIAFMPLVIAGIHLAFTEKKILGFAVTTLGFALHLRENHLQVCYYLAMIVGVYGLVQLILAIREKRIADFFKTVTLLIPAIGIAIGTFFGQLWAITEYSSYSIRGKSELKLTNAPTTTGLNKNYAFEYSNGLLEPIVLILPNFYGGSSSNYLVRNKKSNVYKALANSTDQETANQLANYSSSYWGPQAGTAPYYAGAIICFLFVLGIVFAEKKYVWWLLPLSILSIVLSWGNSFETFNYLLFDYLPGYNKFRSVTFALGIALFCMPLLGLLGLEKLITHGLDKASKKKLLIILSITGGFCLLILVFGGSMNFLKEGEAQLPAWFTKALADDRKSLLRTDAFRSLAFILVVFGAIYFEVWKRISLLAFCAFLAILTLIDLVVVDKRYFTEDNFMRSRESAAMAMTEADEEILKDKSDYRVYNLQGPMSEAHTSYYHHSVGGYHGAKMRRYQDLYDSCIVEETNQLITDAQTGKLDFKKLDVLNMLNVKYIVYGPGRDNIIPNSEANGSAWFVQEVISVKNANEELEKTRSSNTRQTAVIDGIQFKAPSITADSTSDIKLMERTPNYLKYESQSLTDGLAVFSEIYYPKGWMATIDGKDTEILRANYALRALTIPSGKHSIEFHFKPKAYFIGNKITMASSWVLLIVVAGGLVWTWKREGSVIR